MLSGCYSVNKALEMANEVLGLRTRKFRRSGGGKLTKSGLYRIFGNPFYYGLIERGGMTSHGVHEPVITEEEFWQVQRLLGRHGRPRSKKHEFAFTGLIKCGKCGCSITAEEKFNRYGYHYIYYHCTKKREPCDQRSVEVKELEGQILKVLEKISLSESYINWLFNYIDKLDREDDKVNENVNEALEKALKEAEKNLENLTAMRIKDFITDEEYIVQRNKFLREQESLKLRLKKEVNSGGWLEPTRESFIFANRATFLFKDGNSQQKRLILDSIGSNLLLKDKKLNIELQKPFSIIGEGLKSRSGWGLVHDVRTFFLNLSDEAALVKTNLAKLKDRFRG
jgi:hypothetical protein